MTNPKAKSWQSVRSAALATGALDEDSVAHQREVLRGAERAARLADLRRRTGRTQVELAVAMKVSQSRVSKIERGDLAATELATLQAYVAAIGGQLRIVAEFDDESHTLTG